MSRHTPNRHAIITVPTSPALDLKETLDIIGITLRAGANGRIIANPRHLLTPELADAIKQHRAAILEYLATGHIGALVPADAAEMPYEEWHTRNLDKQAAAYRAARNQHHE